MKTLTLIAVCLFVVLHPLDARAWDTGPDKCIHDECTGGTATGVQGDKSLKWSGNTHLWVVTPLKCSRKATIRRPRGW